MQTIEGHRFSAIVNLASDFRTFLTILEQQAAVQTLAESMRDAGVTLEVLRRVQELADSPIEADYEHPADGAMAAYLWLLSNQDTEASERAAQMILDCKQCWWSRKMAERVREAARLQSYAAPTPHVDGGAA
jgi:hypothetical protein